jgi:hypothetical protein
MATRKSAKKTAPDADAVPPVAKKAAKKATKKAATKKATTKTAVKKSSATSPVRGTPDEIARAAYLNYRRRVEQGLPGDSEGDWLEAERFFSGS